jgi:hypothetical protein
MDVLIAAAGLTGAAASYPDSSRVSAIAESSS